MWNSTVKYAVCLQSGAENCSQEQTLAVRANELDILTM